MRYLAPALFFLILVSPLQAITIHVPGDSTTIQGAINGCSNGDTVMIDPGTYYEHNIEFNGKLITVTGTNPEDSSVVASTIVDGDSAGGIFSFQYGVDSTAILSGLTLTGGLATYGGGVYCSNNSSPTIYKNIIASNTANYDGGGIYCSSSSPIIEGNTILENTAGNEGGGIYCHLSNSNIFDNTIAWNISGTDGGGIYCAGNVGVPDPTIEDNIIQGNTATNGAGIFVTASSLLLNNNTISSNIASNKGGGVFCRYYEPIISNNTISENEAEDAGGIYTRSDASIEGNIISYNTASSFGGGIYCSNRPEISTLSNNEITGNTAYGGGGVYSNYASPIIFNNMIYNNMATFSGGGIECYNYSYPDLKHNTIVDNTADSLGGGFSCWESSPVLSNVILFSNNAPLGREMCLGGPDWNPSTVTISYSDFEGGQDSAYVETNSTLNWGAGMFDAPPVFVDPPIGDYHLTSESPCVDAGTDAGIYIDYEGESRPSGYGFDIGADESPFSVSINLTLIPGSFQSVPGGGSFEFGTLIQNNADNNVSGEIWLSVLMPNSNEILVPNNFVNYSNPLSGQVNANSLMELTYEVDVPSGAPTGFYEMIGRIGVYPNTVIDEESFEFEVIE